MQSLITDADRPSKILERVLDGRLNLDDAPADVQSWARLPIHQAAMDIIAIQGLERRRAALAKIPDTVRDAVKKEIRKQWSINY